MFTSKTKKNETVQPATAPATIMPQAVPRVEAEPKSPKVRNEPQNVNRPRDGHSRQYHRRRRSADRRTAVRGDVTTKTNLIVGPTCVIEGNIVAEHAEVAGQVKGTVQALGLLIIKSSSMIDGDVLTKNLNVESGSTFNGRFTVGSVAEYAASQEDRSGRQDGSQHPGQRRSPSLPRCFDHIRYVEDLIGLMTKGCQAGRPNSATGFRNLTC